MASKALCAGINIGYGHLKLSTPAGLFLTTSAVAPSNPLYDGIGRARDTHKVTYSGVEYEVGAEAILLTRTPETARLPLPKWLGTNRYRVLAELVKNRLAQEAQSWNVVIGLPVSDYRDAAYRKSVKAFWQGAHDTENGFLDILNATVVPEPIGAVFAYMQDYTPEQISEESRWSRLVLDIGFFATDWLTLNRMSPDLEQSRGIDIGMHAILTRMAKHIAADHNKSGAGDLITLETLLLEQIATGRKGKVDIVAYAESAAAEVVPALLDDLQANTYRWMRTDLPKKVLIAGGAATFLLPHVRRIFPDIPAHILPDPQTVNATGYRIQCEMRHEQEG
jgi:hypothetical protein